MLCVESRFLRGKEGRVVEVVVVEMEVVLVEMVEVPGSRPISSCLISDSFNVKYLIIIIIIFLSLHQNQKIYRCSSGERKRHSQSRGYD